jgi:hypothetical protein
MKSFDVMVGNTIHSEQHIKDYVMVHIYRYVSGTTIVRAYY